MDVAPLPATRTGVTTPTTVAIVTAWLALLVGPLLRLRPTMDSTAITARLGLDPTDVGSHPRRRRPGRRLPAARPGRKRRAEAAIADAVPDVIDLFAVAVASGLNTRIALRAVAERATPGALADALRRVEQRVEASGARLADTIERLPDELSSESVRPLVAAITDAERYGAALGPTLDRLADDARRTRQRHAEEAARRIPVKLLFPLVTCILPAFGLLTVAPLIAGGLRALRL